MKENWIFENRVTRYVYRSIEIEAEMILTKFRANRNKGEEE